jgi:hypothetical protein
MITLLLGDQGLGLAHNEESMIMQIIDDAERES